jgi:phosphorylase/glycogen(starch) synthase
MQIDNLFEVSWEVCNKVGGINTVISTKADELAYLGDKYILLGPDLIKEGQSDTVFIEDSSLFQDWKQELNNTGISVRTGRWNLPSKPIVFLLDFSTLYPGKDKIFTDLWDDYQLDSLNGRWDYIEPAIFGYAAGMAIKSFSDFYQGSAGNSIAHFHEWMTGSGVLFLKKQAPNVATVFTTHATILGRVLAGNHLPLYDMLDTVQPYNEAARFNIKSKYSMERTVAQQVDVFTTVSDLTANECEKLLMKKPDIVTPNGFNLGFLPQEEDFKQQHDRSREQVLQAAKHILGYDLDKDSHLVLTSGRYEFKNKGLDLFIDAMASINASKNKLDKEILAVIAVPANSGEIHPIVQRRMEGDFSDPTPGYLSHRIYDEHHDPVLRMVKEKGLGNEKNARVKVIFVPVYLIGNDGLFNLDYYEFLLGFDQTAFLSYYEPWGYTPMESLAFRIPTVTTTLAGFGLWIKDILSKGNTAAHVVERNEHNYQEAMKGLVSSIESYMQADAKIVGADCRKISELALWENLISHYEEAYSMALSKAKIRIENADTEYFVERGQGKKIVEEQSGPKWKKSFIAPRVPELLQPLVELSRNLWWTWNFEAAHLFKTINPERWIKLKYNPIELIESLDISEMEALERNEAFVAKLNKVYKSFKSYMAEAPKNPDKIAYFSMEYGLHDTLKIYSGGLGILAGDYLKEISDKGVNLVGVGLLYRYGYFKQNLTPDGTQIAESKAQKFTHMPVDPVLDADGNWKTIQISLPGRQLFAKIWKVQVGRVALYLLDTDIEANNPADRQITHHLYGGGNEMRLLQEILLGVGGVRALAAVEEHTQIFHLNEGHAAMAGLERLRVLMVDHRLSLKKAIEVVRASALFTTHTPVPAGHDRFDEDMVRRYLPHYADRLQMDWNDFMALGRENKYDFNEKFSMSILAARLSQEMNGVSKIHGQVSRKMFSNMFKGYLPDELYIGHVTNGVHWPTWTAKSWQKFFIEHVDENFFEKQNQLELWQKVNEAPNHLLWEKRQLERSRLISYLKTRLQKQLQNGFAKPNDVVRMINSLDENALTIGFARRFATYKRAHLLFTDLDRLAKLVGQKDRPVQFIFAGKAHPADKAGQDLIKRIIEISRMPEFEGKIIFVPDYDIDLGKKLTQGVDVWLNNPTRPLEASGTSGEKAVMNGVLNLSVLDGWWAEGYVEGGGWALEENRVYEDQELQNQLDAAYIYQLLEGEIKESFYKRDKQNIPNDWVKKIKRNFTEIAPHFTMNRMVEDYVHLFYNPLIERSKKMNANQFAIAEEILQWKEMMQQEWRQIEVAKMVYPDSSKKPMRAGDEFKLEVCLSNMTKIADYVKVEVIMVKKQGDAVEEFISSQELQRTADQDGQCCYTANITVQQAGVINYALRVYAWNELLPHRQDFLLVEWI